MPEELAIILVVLIGAVWLIVAIFKGLANGIDAISKRSDRAIAQRNQEKKNRLSRHIRVVIPGELEKAQKQLGLTDIEFTRFQQTTKWIASPPTWSRKPFVTCSLPAKRDAYDDMCIEDIQRIQAANPKTWVQEESELLALPCTYPVRPPAKTCIEFKGFPSLTLNLDNAAFEYDPSKVSERNISRYFEKERQSVIEYNARRAEIMSMLGTLNQQIQEWNVKSRLQWQDYEKESARLADRQLSEFIRASELYATKCKEQKQYFNSILEGYQKCAKNDVIARFNYVLSYLTLPRSIPHTWDIDFDEEQQILIVEIGLPDVVHRPPFKMARLKSGDVRKPLNQTEKRTIILQVHPAILLRVAFEVFRNDHADIIRLLVLNGWLTFDDPRTGINTKSYTASLMVESEQIVKLNLDKIDPLVAFNALHGKSAGSLVEIIPIEPTLALNKKDSRFVDAKEVLSMLGTDTNLAAMDWQDFEHLIRELFEKEFSGRGAEVKITQASRDRGVDAIVFDPDPIHGGKYVIQAKRYTNTVDVSAVRDLCAVVKKEGASRGILVTTSAYGADAYAFANNEPITLLNGGELLGLLKKHGYGFRINLQEARQLSQTNLQKGEKFGDVWRK